MGRRGETWVIIQAGLLLLLLLVPQVGVHWPVADVFRTVGWLLIVLGVLVVTWGALSLGRSLTPFPRPLPEGRLVTTGAYRFVRHPIYLGVVLGSLGFALATLSPLRLAVTVVLFIFFDMKARREESWLQHKYPEYAAYRSRVKKMIPWIY